MKISIVYHSEMLVYSGGGAQGKPFLHFGAVSARAPEEELYKQRCIKLG